MAVSRRTQKDIGNYEPKFIGPFTVRMTIFTFIGVLAGGFVGLFIYSLSGGTADTMTIAVFPVIIAVVFAIFGKAKPYGMKAEDYLKAVYLSRVKSPTKRKYKTETMIDLLSIPEETKEDDPKNKQKQTKPVHKPDKKYPDYA